MSTHPTVKFTLELDQAHALALAQFLKRVGHADCVGRADPNNKEEPHLMLGALETERWALAEQTGIAPR